jgi:hypothetical protein
MIKAIDVTGLSPDQLQQVQSIIEVFKAKNNLDNHEAQTDMIEYLLENPIKVDDLKFIKRGEIYDRT